jgi:hypothetical protein
MNKFFKKYILSPLFILAFISSCSTPEQYKSTNVNTLAAPIQEKSIQPIEPIANVFSSLKEQMVYKQLYLYDRISTTGESLLSEACEIFIQPIPTPSSEYKDFIHIYSIDNGTTFSFLRYAQDHYSVLGYRCNSIKKLNEIEAAYYDCSVEKNISKCFLLSVENAQDEIFEPELALSREKVSALRKSAIHTLCKMSSDACDFTNLLAHFKYPDRTLTKKEIGFIHSAIVNVKKVKTKERDADFFKKTEQKKAEELELQKVKIAEELELKKIKIAKEIEFKKKKNYEKIESSCNKGNAQSCWNLYISTLDENQDLARSFVARACKLGSQKACMVDERNRQEKFHQEQVRLQKESIESERQLANKTLEREQEAEHEKLRKEEQEQWSQIARDASAAITGSMANDRRERQRQLEKAEEERKRQQEKFEQQMRDDRIRYTDCNTDSDGTIRCRTH